MHGDSVQSDAERAAVRSWGRTSLLSRTLKTRHISCAHRFQKHLQSQHTSHLPALNCSSSSGKNDPHEICCHPCVRLFKAHTGLTMPFSAQRKATQAATDWPLTWAAGSRPLRSVAASLKPELCHQHHLLTAPWGHCQ